MPDIVPIPQPPTHAYGFLGNLPDVDPSFALKSLRHLSELYGPIYQLDLLSRKFVVVSSYQLAHEVCDDEHYEKIVTGQSTELRALSKDALFTAHNHEPNWGKAHRTLMPVFGVMGVRKILAFDTIGLCFFNYRFNDFYSENVHPFAHQMTEVLLEAAKRGNRSRLQTSMSIWSTAKMQENIDAMHKLCKEIIAERKAHPQPDVDDLLNTMLNAADPVTGEKLDDENIRNQMVTFLVAGHETTSGTLSFLFYNLLKYPETLQKAQQEVDQVLGDAPVDVKHLAQFKYVDACIKETLRITGPIGAISRHAKQDTILAGQYSISKDVPIMLNLQGIHTDPAVWGNDSKVFRPERMLDFDKIPPDAWRPFGVGDRACIGRVFTEQEMILNVALILQRFQVEMVDPMYDLTIRSTLTLKPDGLRFKVRRRPGKDMMVGLAGGMTTQRSNAVNGVKPTGVGKKSKMTIAYGSNAGTCKAFAEDLQTRAPEFGFEAAVTTLDQATENIPKDIPFIVITSSYEGKPPDNAKKFVAWLEANSSGSTLDEVHYALFGVGNSEWASTYHKVPKDVEGLLRKQGAKQIYASAFADVKRDCTGDWENWAAGLWQKLHESGQAGSLEHKSELKTNVIKHDVPSALNGQEMSWGLVKSAKSLGGFGVGPEKRELEVHLPEGTTYRTGDYLVVLPFNPQSNVQRVLANFHLHPDDRINISGTRKSFLQSKEPIGAAEFFYSRVELNSSVTQRQLEVLISHATSDIDRTALKSLTSDEEFQSQVIDRNYSLIDVLEDHSSVALPLASYIDMLKPLAPRQYSISSSPLTERHHPTHETFTATITYDVYTAPARSGGHRTFHGVATTYLANLRPGSRIHCFVRPTNAAFHLPPDPTVPIIMIAAGTGIAPMRGFIEERAAIASARAIHPGPALLYFGCRDYEKDFIYREELAEWEQQGVVTVRPCFSKRGPEADGYEYVPDRLWAEREELVKMFEAGSKTFLCGSADKLAKSTAEVLMKIWLERYPEKSAEEAEAWLQTQKEDRYVTDVFD
ncbi:bifunctional cytochrome P450/NADPH P450 reductase [Physcia stellaris]|nr:bifunctional cytochrome P450/NADPH P450 reductase [Physcia stellaris]